MVDEFFLVKGREVDRYLQRFARAGLKQQDLWLPIRDPAVSGRTVVCVDQIPLVVFGKSRFRAASACGAATATSPPAMQNKTSLTCFG